jgi:hypothetical protein
MPAKVMIIEERFKCLTIQRPRYWSGSRAELTLTPATPREGKAPR